MTTYSQAYLVRRQITRAGITTAPGASTYLEEATRFAARSWGFLDGSVLVLRGDYERLKDTGSTPEQISRRRWAAYNPR